MAKKETADDKHKLIRGVRHKMCSTCKQFIPETDFSTRKASADGLAYSCKPCERAAAQRSYARKKSKKKSQERYQANRDVYKERAKQRYQENPEAALAATKAWRQTRKGQESTRVASARRRERILAQTPGGRDYTREDIIKRDSVDGQCICQICMEPIIDMSDMQIDHIVSIAAGGADVASNVRCTHKLCNLTRPKDASDL